MKPQGSVARRVDYSFDAVPHAQARAFISAHHYAKGCSNGGAMYGAYRAGALVGVSQWLPPTRVCAESVHSDWKRVVSLSRLVCLPDEPQNLASMLIGAFPAVAAYPT